MVKRFWSIFTQGREINRYVVIYKRLIPNDKKDYFDNISNDKKVLETFVCSYVESLDDFDFEP